MDSKSIKVKDENFYQISGWMINKLNLKGIPLMVYAIIFGFSQDGESEFSGSRKYLCDFTGTTKPTIDKALNELIESNFIIKISETKNSIVFNKYKVNLDMLNFTTDKETLLGGDKETLLGGGKETLPNNNNINNNNINNNNIKENNINNIIEEIFDFWNSKNIIKHSKFTDARKKAIAKVLKEYSIEDIKLAIEHYSIILKDKNYFFNYTWSLEDFLNRKTGFTTFLNDGSNWVNYNKPKIIKQNNGLTSYEYNPNAPYNNRGDNDII